MPFFHVQLNRPCVSPYFDWIVTKYFSMSLARYLQQSEGEINSFKNRDLFSTIFDLSENAVKAMEMYYNIIFIYKQIDRPCYYDTQYLHVTVLGIMCNNIVLFTFLYPPTPYNILVLSII